MIIKTQTPRSLTDEVDLIFSFPISSSILLLSEPRLLRNLSGFTIILLLWSQLIAASYSDSRIGSNYLSVLAKLAKVLSSTKLWTGTFDIKKKKLLKKILYKIGLKIEPWATPDMIVSNSIQMIQWSKPAVLFEWNVDVQTICIGPVSLIPESIFF